MYGGFIFVIKKIEIRQGFLKYLSFNRHCLLNCATPVAQL